MHFPQHVVELALSWTQGIDVGIPLTDALIEIGYDADYAKRHILGKDGIGCLPGHHCLVIHEILDKNGGCPKSEYGCSGWYLRSSVAG